MIATVNRDLKKLASLQNEDGGFGFWARTDKEWPYLGIYVAHAVQIAKAKGFAVPDEMLERSQEYLKKIDKHIQKEYSQEARRALQAYALFVRHLMKDNDAAEARRADYVEAGGVERMPLEALGWLLPVLKDDAASQDERLAIRRHLVNRVSETAGAANFVTSYGDGAYLMLHSDRRTDGVLLEALIGDDPNSDLIPKLVRGLLAARTKGRWENTQENAFVLLALDRYFNDLRKGHA